VKIRQNATTTIRRRVTSSRWAFAKLLGRLPWTCWADLGVWALDGHAIGGPPRPLPPVGAVRGRQCQAEGGRPGSLGSCWCRPMNVVDGQLLITHGGQEEGK